jgi:hypothetical protein
MIEIKKTTAVMIKLNKKAFFALFVDVIFVKKFSEIILDNSISFPYGCKTKIPFFFII